MKIAKNKLLDCFGCFSEIEAAGRDESLSRNGVSLMGAPIFAELTISAIAVSTG
jgi:hypothetical protein